MSASESAKIRFWRFKTSVFSFYQLRYSVSRYSWYFTVCFRNMSLVLPQINETQHWLILRVLNFWFEDFRTAFSVSVNFENWEVALIDSWGSASRRCCYGDLKLIRHRELRELNLGFEGFRTDFSVSMIFDLGSHCVMI